jgi:hypothetical protein
VLTVADYPDGSIGEVTVVIANPDAAPVLVGVTPRRRGRLGRGLLPLPFIFPWPH